MADFQAEWEPIREVLQQAEDRYRAQRLRPTPDWPPKGEEAKEIRAAAEEACHLYRRATDSERNTMREFMASTYRASDFLWHVMGDLEKRLAETEEARWLELALAAASLEDLKLDFRDSYLALGSLYLTALKAGIEPGHYFQAAAELSSDRPDHSSSSMREFLARFEKSAHFKSSVEPKARRIRARKA